MHTVIVMAGFLGIAALATSVTTGFWEHQAEIHRWMTQ